MEKNCIEEFPSSNNYRSVNFNYNNINYEINTSLYNNAIIIFICYNAKIAKMYELNIDIEEEQQKNEFHYYSKNDEDNIEDIDIAQCILGKRGNDKIDFIANFIMTYIKDIILKINSKINKICLSLNLDDELKKNLENNDKVKQFIDAVKNNVEKIFQVTKNKK